MGRTGEAENKSADADYKAAQTNSLKQSNDAIANYNAQRNTLASGGSIATNPWQDPTYLRDQNANAAFASSGANAAAKEQLDNEAQRTGENTEARKATVASLARQKSRDMMQLQTGQSADNYNKYQAYQQQLLGDTLAPAGAAGNIYSASVGGRNNADTNLSNIGMAGQQMWGNIIGAGLQAGGAVGAKAV